MTRSLSRLFALPLAAVALTACPPIEGPLGPGRGGELREGTWRIDIEDAYVDGRCDGVRARDIIEGGPYLMDLRTDGRMVGARFEGMDMQGGIDARWLELHGFLSMEGEPGVPEEPRPGEEESRPGEEEIEVGGGEVDEEAPPAPCEAEPEPPGGGSGGGGGGATPPPTEGPGIRADLYGDIVAPERFAGTLTVSYDLPDMRCAIEAELVATWVSEGGVEEEPRPLEDDEDWSDEGDGEDRGDDDGDDEGEAGDDCDWEVEDC
ncbi:MAG: hypothetical protein H6742_03445 [Alphaproteobacteria bacterium]|nr:hypothetical protein [Alphaproteobacteria bacterium]